MKPATKDSWTTHPLPAQHARLSAGWKYSNEEYLQIKQGLIPEVMEDKWFVYFQDDVLYLHRSWTGFCIFQVQFQPCGSGYQVSQVLVSRDAEQYRESSDAEDLALLRYLVDALLLGKEVPFPTPQGLQGPVQAAISQRHLVGRTRRDQPDHSPLAESQRRRRP